MATFFGEVLSVSSRAVDDDEDDDNDFVEACPTEIKWNPEVKGLCESIEKGTQMKCSSMLIAVGVAPSGFAQAYLLNDGFEIVAALSSGFPGKDTKLFEQRSLADKTCLLYRSKHQSSQFVCVCNSPVSPEQSYSWTSQLLEYIDLTSAQVFVFSSSVVSDYVTDMPVSELKLPFLRALRTSYYTDTPVCPYLEQPNVINGLPAQILSYLHMKKVKAILYTCYTDTIFLDSRTIHVFKSVLSSAPLNTHFKENPNANDVVKKIVNLQTLSNTLYL